MDSKFFTNDFFSIKTEADKAKKLKDFCGGFNSWIVYLDDDADALDLVSEDLVKFGFKVMATSSHLAAVEFIQKHRSQMALILVDYNMPELNGFEFRKQILEYTDIPFVILSGFVDREMALQGISLKISSFLEKPFDLNEFKKVLITEVDARVCQIKDDLELLSSFLSDADMIVEQMEEIFLELEDRPNDKDLLQKAYGLLHTMKGNAGFFEPRTLHEFAHAFEDQIKLVHEGRTHLNSNILSSWLKATDTIKGFIEEFKALEHSEKPLENYLLVFNVDKDAQDLAQEEGPASTVKTESEKPKEIRVSVSVLDEFMMVSGEMTVIRNMINKSVLSLEKKYSSDKDVQLVTELLNEMHKINADVQSKITDIRRVGVKSIIRPLIRTARDTARSLEKEIEMEVSGDELRADHSIAELLSHSLIHLIRNSIDHGMETKEERAKTNKPEKGSLKLEFMDHGDFIETNIMDDGRGIDVEKIKRKALEKKIRTESELAHMEEEEVLSLLFDAGFSTAEQVTQYSGRGVGLNMVLASVEDLGGHIKLHSKIGEGSCFNIKVPIPKSATIASCLFVNIEKKVFGVPQDHIEKVISVSEHTSVKIDKVKDSYFLRHNNNLLPIIEFNSSAGRTNFEKFSQAYFLLVIQSEKHHYCMKVDDIMDVEDSVIKELQLGTLKALKLYSGGTFLPDGSVGLVLNVDGVAEHCGVGELKKSIEAAAANVGKEQSLKAVDIGRFVSFVLDGVGKCCLRESEVLRVEEIKKSHVQISGNMCLLPYHHSLLYFVDTKTYFNTGSIESISLEEFNHDLLKVIVVMQDNYFIGFVVDDIIGLEEIEDKVHPLNKKSKACTGRLLQEGKSFCLMNIVDLSPQTAILPEKSEGNYGLSEVS